MYCRQWLAKVRGRFFSGALVLLTAMFASCAGRAKRSADSMEERYAQQGVEKARVQGTVSGCLAHSDSEADPNSPKSAALVADQTRLYPELCALGKSDLHYSSAYPDSYLQWQKASTTPSAYRASALRKAL